MKVDYSDPTPGDQLGITADIGMLRNDYKLHELISVDVGLRKMCDWARLKNEKKEISK